MGAKAPSEPETAWATARTTPFLLPGVDPREIIGGDYDIGKRDNANAQVGTPVTMDTMGGRGGADSFAFP